MDDRGSNGPTRGNRAPRREMLLKELGGKHNAAQAYDERIWKIRSGFLALSFGGWAALLGIGETLNAAKEAAPGMLVLTLSLALAAMWVEAFYVRRKYRCLAVINQMCIRLYELGEHRQPTSEEVQEWLRFTGDDSAVNPQRTDGFRLALFETGVVYVLPIIGICLAVLLLLATGTP